MISPRSAHWLAVQPVLRLPIQGSFQYLPCDTCFAVKVIRIPIASEKLKVEAV